MNKKTQAELLKIENHDPQGRNDETYPKPNIPDTIYSWDGHEYIEITFEFKNTTEKTAIRYATNYLKKWAHLKPEITAAQAGDYHNDWVVAYARFWK